MMVRTTFLCAALLCASIAAPAQAKQLSGNEIKRFIGGKRVLLATPYGLEFPLLYRQNGQVAGDATGFRLSNFFAPKETGRWWIRGNSMCQQFKTWYRGRAFCFEITKTGPKSLNWRRNDGLAGTAKLN